MIDQSMKPIRGTISSGQSGPERNGNQEILFTLKISRTGASLSDSVLCQPQNISF